MKHIILRAYHFKDSFYSEPFQATRDHFKSLGIEKKMQLSSLHH